MSSNLQTVRKTLSQERRARINARARELKRLGELLAFVHYIAVRENGSNYEALRARANALLKPL